MKAFEINFDGIVGPTHNYSGLSYGNLASTGHAMMVSNPKAAALQGLKKMKFLSDLGVKQAVLPPQDRPDIATLHALGFRGSDSEIIEAAFKTAPEIFFRACSASSMWSANIATITPSCDAADQMVHISPANLVTLYHRTIEAAFTHSLMQRIFCDEGTFKVHKPLPSTLAFADEGAANHTLLCPNYGESGVHLFAYGHNAFDREALAPKRFPARQTLAASEAIARRHQIYPNHALFIQQNPEVVDLGVFHNDVIAVGNRNVFFTHEKAYVDQNEELTKLKTIFEQLCDCDLKVVEVLEKDLPVEEAVNTYLFNAQLITLEDGKTALIAPIECRESSQVQQLLNGLVKDQECPIDIVRFVDVRESMSNGGGPACLRLRAQLTENEINSLHQGVILTDALYQELNAWVEKYYRDSLHPHDLADPLLLDENRQALDALTKILKLKKLYPFQGATLEVA